ncbi:unnamed protein product, partial [Mesorhabditis belari]|uniref:Transmembrane protein 234 n=1 Tax=Mesorhabditis belari TaxID=2138241 RepID=A0AAF3ECZ3_9BILA
MECDRWCLFEMLFVSAIWGTTNPFMRIGAKYGSSAGNETGFLQKSLSTVANWRFFLPFLVNQFGSISFTFLVARLPVSIVVPTVNSLQFVFAALAGQFLGERLSIKFSAQAQARLASARLIPY